MDYRMLDDPDEVTRLLHDVNVVLAAVDTRDEQEVRRISWKKGVTGRAYYIVGAHMAERIQTDLGRDALIRTIVEGPTSFATLYNSLVPDDRRVDFESTARETTRQRISQVRRRNIAMGAAVVALLLIATFLGWRRLRATG
jgi:hypothetical protein